MPFRPMSLKRVLEKEPVEASAPCRIDAGGTWDIKALALPLASHGPLTLNMALNLRTRVRLSPFEDGQICVASEGFRSVEKHSFQHMPFNSTFGLFFATAAHFGFHGFQITIRSDSPVKSALGGSSTALIAFIKGLSRVSAAMGLKALSPKEMLHLGYHLEDGVNGGFCGIQDQAAAVYGGINLWHWRYGDSRAPLRRERLLDRRGEKALTRRILVANSGKSHVSKKINKRWVEDFMGGRSRAGWIKANRIVRALADAIRGERWAAAAARLQEEMDIRRAITPNALIPVTEKLIQQAEDIGCGARFAGAGAGGSVWALGPEKRIQTLRQQWEQTLRPKKGAGILDCEIDSKGVL